MKCRFTTQRDFPKYMKRKMNTTNKTYETATGRIEYPMTNDFVFRAILQRNKQVLIALICSLLHLPEKGVDAEITNPIELGAAFSNKDFILDIRVRLSNGRLIDLEMQIANEHNWPERSISYAARSFDNLNSGENYVNVMPVHSIGFLDFTLFSEEPEFYATYQIQNVKTGKLYSSKFSIHVVDLSQIELATEEDRAYGIERWASLFKTTTWEDSRMISKDNSVLQQASNELYTINADEILRQQARARADAEFWERHTQAQLQKQAALIQEQEEALQQKDETIAMQAELIRKLQDQVAGNL